MSSLHSKGPAWVVLTRFSRSPKLNEENDAAMLDTWSCNSPAVQQNCSGSGKMVSKTNAIEDDRNTFCPSPFTRARESMTAHFFRCVQHTPVWPLQGKECQSTRPQATIKSEPQKTTNKNTEPQQSKFHLTCRKLVLDSLKLDNQSCWINAIHLLQSSLTIFREGILSKIIKHKSLHDASCWQAAWMELFRSFWMVFSRPFQASVVNANGKTNPWWHEGQLQIGFDQWCPTTCLNPFAAWRCWLHPWRVKREQANQQPGFFPFQLETATATADSFLLEHEKATETF